MNREEISNRLMSEFPEFAWDEDLYGVYCGANFCIEWNIDDKESLSIPYTVLNQLKKSAVQHNHTKLIAILATIGVYEEIEIPCEDIDEKMFDAIIFGIKNWKTDMDKLRHGEDKQQLIMLHPDVDDYSAKDILEHTTILSADEDGFRLGLINAKDYNFGNADFRDIVFDNSRECFAIWEPDKPFAQACPELYVQVKQLYPMIDSISDFYLTDYD